MCTTAAERQATLKMSETRHVECDGRADVKIDVRFGSEYARHVAYQRCPSRDCHDWEEAQGTLVVA